MKTTLREFFAVRKSFRHLILLPLFHSGLFAGALLAQPANDDCSGAIPLTIGTTTTGTVVNSTLSAPVPAACSGTATYDVWYSFVATGPDATITLKSSGSSGNFRSPAIQLFSGTCGSLSSLGCSGTGFTATLNTSALTMGTTYYIRVFSTNGSAPTSSGSFNILVTSPDAVVKYGKTYVDVSKGSTGGTVQPGDTLEIRATFTVKSNTAYNCSFADNVPGGTTYIPGTLRVLTNEGKIYQQFTDALDGDAGDIAGSAITINLGIGATASNGGSIASNQKPSFYGAKCINVASYRVKVNATNVYGNLISVGGGTLQYNPYTSGSATTIVFPQDTIKLYPNYGICPNTVGTNAIINEYGGTFGSGNTKDRVPSGKVSANYTYALFSSTAGMPNDEFYGVSNNTSGGTTAATGYSVLNNWAKPDNSQNPSHRIFRVWDIIGDHTGAANPLLGNPATDDNAGSTGGYMAVINADFATAISFLDTIYNLCPNTYYEYSAWIRNICAMCGCDSNGVGATSGNAAYIPTGPGDSSGVHPNLTFNVNGYDYYTTGDMPYKGQWAQKGFTYLTGPTQTSMVIYVRNNAPGGGGNDYAIDDIGVSTCSPNMVLTPSKPDTVCQGKVDSVNFKVMAFFNNYTEWLLQKSTDGGTTWTSAGTDTAGKAASGSATPVYNSVSGQYEYLVTRYFKLNLVDTLIKYRLVVASTVANLSNPSCAFITLSPKIIHAIDCNIVLPTSILSFKGQVQDGLGHLQWISSNESDGIMYIVERSDDGTHFNTIGSIKGQAVAGGGAFYNFTDPTPVSATSYYRINITMDHASRYSNQVLLSNTDIGLELRNLVNPFTDHITMDLTAPGNGPSIVRLMDIYGKTIRMEKQSVSKGLNTLSLYDLGSLPIGTYVLQVRYEDKMISRKVVKLAK